MLIAQSRPTLCDSMYCSLPGSVLGAKTEEMSLEMGCPTSPGDLPNPGIEPVSAALWADDHLSHFGSLRLLELIVCMWCEVGIPFSFILMNLQLSVV